jgi:hypothetical protein
MFSYTLVGFFILAALVVVYFAPWLIASSRHHHNKFAILVLNILAGWTVVGWIAALVWASTSPESSLVESGARASSSDTPSRFCQGCGKPHGGGAYCRSCGIDVRANA